MMHSTSALQSTPTLHRRNSVERLTEQQLSELREAYGAVYQIQDDRGYNHHAGIHGLPLPIYCRHGTPEVRDPLFLPWHRAYLYWFELALRDRVPSVSQPWWDWRTPLSRASEIPGIYAAQRVGEEPNPLYSVPIPPGAQQDAPQVGIEQPPRETFRRPGEPAAPRLPTPQEVEQVLQAPNFLDFSDQVEDLHGWVHVWIGGTTAEVPWAAYDPLFWAHHAMIDRLWRTWQLRNPETNFDRGFLRQALPPFAMTVEDTLDVTALGYEYASSTEHLILEGS